MVCGLTKLLCLGKLTANAAQQLLAVVLENRGNVFLCLLHGLHPHIHRAKKYA